MRVLLLAVAIAVAAAQTPVAGQASPTTGQPEQPSAPAVAAATAAVKAADAKLKEKAAAKPKKMGRLTGTQAQAECINQCLEMEPKPIIMKLCIKTCQHHFPYTSKEIPRKKQNLVRIMNAPNQTKAEQMSPEEVKRERLAEVNGIMQQIGGSAELEARRIRAMVRRHTRDMLVRPIMLNRKKDHCDKKCMKILSKAKQNTVLRGLLSAASTTLSKDELRTIKEKLRWNLQVPVKVGCEKKPKQLTRRKARRLGHMLARIWAKFESTAAQKAAEKKLCSGRRGDAADVDGDEHKTRLRTRLARHFTKTLSLPLVEKGKEFIKRHPW